MHRASGSWHLVFAWNCRVASSTPSLAASPTTASPTSTSSTVGTCATPSTTRWRKRAVAVIVAAAILGLRRTTLARLPAELPLAVDCVTHPREAKGWDHVMWTLRSVLGSLPVLVSLAVPTHPVILALSIVLLVVSIVLSLVELATSSLLVVSIIILTQRVWEAPKVGGIGARGRPMPCGVKPARHMRRACRGSPGIIDSGAPFPVVLVVWPRRSVLPLANAWDDASEVVIEPQVVFCGPRDTAGLAGLVRRPRACRCRCRCLCRCGGRGRQRTARRQCLPVATVGLLTCIFILAVSKEG